MRNGFFYHDDDGMVPHFWSIKLKRLAFQIRTAFGKGRGLLCGTKAGGVYHSLQELDPPLWGEVSIRGFVS